MNKQQWNEFENAVLGRNETVSPALIVDSPWMPGYYGMTNVDFYARSELWFESYLRLRRDFPGLLLLPDWWVEYGMATEPASFGCKIDFSNDAPPVVHHIYSSIDELAESGAPAVPDLRKSGLTPLALSLQHGLQPRIQALGEDYTMVCARGPFTIASHLLSLTELMVGIKIEPDAVRALLKVTTAVSRQWLALQLENVKNAKAVMVLDDVCGFLGAEDFQEFAEPCFAELFGAFPGLLHIFHNDTDNDAYYPFVDRMGVDAINTTHKKDIARIRRMLGSRVAIIGNIPPMALANETPEAVRRLADNCIASYVAENGSARGLLLSAGGGAPMGARGENLLAMIESCR